MGAFSREAGGTIPGACFLNVAALPAFRFERIAVSMFMVVSSLIARRFNAAAGRCVPLSRCVALLSPFDVPMIGRQRLLNINKLSLLRISV
jgi:hypothetical protein